MTGLVVFQYVMLCVILVLGRVIFIQQQKIIRLNSLLNKEEEITKGYQDLSYKLSNQLIDLKKRILEVINNREGE